MRLNFPERMTGPEPRIAEYVCSLERIQTVQLEGMAYHGPEGKKQSTHTECLKSRRQSHEFQFTIRHGHFYWKGRHAVSWYATSATEILVEFPDLVGLLPPFQKNSQCFPPWKSIFFLNKQTESTFPLVLEVTSDHIDGSSHPTERQFPTLGTVLTDTHCFSLPTLQIQTVYRQNGVSNLLSYPNISSWQNC